MHRAAGRIPLDRARKPDARAACGGIPLPAQAPCSQMPLSRFPQSFAVGVRTTAVRSSPSHVHAPGLRAGEYSAGRR